MVLPHPPVYGDVYDRRHRSQGNVLLLLMVIFENFHIGNCRLETKSAFLSPLRSPMLLFGALRNSPGSSQLFSRNFPTPLHRALLEVVSTFSIDVN